MIQGKQVRQLGATGLWSHRSVLAPTDGPTARTTRLLLRRNVRMSMREGTFLLRPKSTASGNPSACWGAYLRQDKRPAVIASKYMPMPLHPFKTALDGSLKHLGVQTIDLYSIHVPRGTIEQLMDLMAQAVEEGKIHAIGVSNFSAAQMRLASSRLARYDIPLAANEVQYNLLHREPEVDGVLDACRELNVAMVAYVPLASGRLASTSSSSTRGSEALQTVLTTIAHKRSKSVPQVALNWLLRRDEHIIPIPGATSARHVQENAQALTWELSDEEFAAIDRASRPHTS